MMSTQTIEALDHLCVEIKRFAMRIEPNFSQDRNDLILAALEVQAALADEKEKAKAIAGAVSIALGESQ